MAPRVDWIEIRPSPEPYSEGFVIFILHCERPAVRRLDDAGTVQRVRLRFTAEHVPRREQQKG